MDTREKIIKLLRLTKRKNIDKLIEYMDDSKFFTTPASSKYHLVIEGGLAEHSLNVCLFMAKLKEDYEQTLPWESLVIATLLHDIEKAGKYYFTEKGTVTYSRELRPFGHAQRATEIVRNYIKLTPEEDTLLRFHEGIYKSFEFAGDMGEYALKRYDKISAQVMSLRLMTYADMLVAVYCEDKAFTKYNYGLSFNKLVKNLKEEKNENRIAEK